MSSLDPPMPQHNALILYERKEKNTQKYLKDKTYFYPCIDVSEQVIHGMCIFVFESSHWFIVVILILTLVT